MAIRKINGKAFQQILIAGEDIDNGYQWRFFMETWKDKTDEQSITTKQYSRINHWKKQVWKDHTSSQSIVTAKLVGL